MRRGRRALRRRATGAVRRLPGLAAPARAAVRRRDRAASRTSPRRTCSRSSTSPRSLLGPGESYVEVGSYYGASLIGAMRGNDGDFVAIDRFCVRADSRCKGRQLPAASRAGLEENLRRFGADGATILEGDAFEVIEGGQLGDRRVGVYYFDGPHDYDSQVRGLRGDRAVARRRGAARRRRPRLGRRHAGDARLPRRRAAEARAALRDRRRSTGEPQWWDGVAVLGWRGG